MPSNPQQRQAGRKLTFGLSARDGNRLEGAREIQERDEGERKPSLVGDDGVEFPSAVSVQKGSRPRDPKESTRDSGVALAMEE